MALAQTLLRMALFFSLSLSWVQAASIITKDGQAFTGKILEEEQDHLLIELEDGVQVRIGRDQIEHVQKDDDQEEIFKYKKEYPVLGATVFYPAWGNLVAGYYFEHFGFKLSGGYWGSNAWGAQLNLSLKLSENRDFLNSLSLVLGTTSPKDYMDSFYAGVGVDLNASGFVLEGDLVNGKTKDKGELIPVFIFQMGYVIRFN